MSPSVDQPWAVRDSAVFSGASVLLAWMFAFLWIGFDVNLPELLELKAAELRFISSVEKVLIPFLAFLLLLGVVTAVLPRVARAVTPIAGVSVVLICSAMLVTRFAAS